MASVKDTINLWFIGNDKKKRVPRVFSKVLLNFMLDRYPTNVFEKFSKHRLEFILEELLTKTTDRNFFSDVRPIWWPESIEFVPIPILRQKIEKDALSWILHLQELLLRAREFYGEQLYLSRKRDSKNIKVNKENTVKDATVKAKPKPKLCIKISPSIFKPIRNENFQPNVPILPVVEHKSKIDSQPFVLQNESKVFSAETTHRSFALQRTFALLEDFLRRNPMYVPITSEKSPYPDRSWKPLVYLDDMFRQIYRGDNCKVEVYDILRPTTAAPVNKANYMNTLGLYGASSKPLNRADRPRTVHYKRYSPSVPFSSLGGQLIIGSFKDRYHHNVNSERGERRGCSINDPLRHKPQNLTQSPEDTNSFTRMNKIDSYHVYKFCRRRPFNSLDLPIKISSTYCRISTVNIKKINSKILQLYMKPCKVILPRILPKYLQKARINL